MTFKLPDKSTKIPKSTFALLFGEVVQYCHQKVDSLDQFAKQLQAMGYPIGCTVLEVLSQGSQSLKRPAKEVPMLILIKEKIWPFLFGNQANDLEQQLDDPNCYMIYDEKPMVVQFISHPQDIKNHFSCCSFVAGIIEGILCSAGFACQVSTHPSPAPNAPDKVIYLVKFVGSRQ
ncbi:trafficking protein particle complex subunit 5-like [Histomonas meleagridis]|uniref:trafficking protein particle complex subunit 5-like n=1 Tax=Histomonas meleagridis TaxID=135588 RepID=UPI00355ACA4E|nr:trafficking protein particle complex subunit 5-like [Histomonas meleagridis]KAH0802187.1 trafficking protein particle complex subunit 5-like [Histomonas meleagridis]